MTGVQTCALPICVGVKAVVDRAVKEKTSMIIEGIHLLPNMQQAIKEGTKRAFHIPITLSLMNEKDHRDRFFERGKGNELRRKEIYLRSFENIRIIHEFVNLESRSEEHTSELQSRTNLVCRLLLEKKNKNNPHTSTT